MIKNQTIDSEILESYTKIFKLLTHPTRIAILNILREGEHCVCHMEAYLGLRQAYISQQLSVLRDAELIQDRRDGWNIYYKVIQPEIYEVLDAVDSLKGQSLKNNEKIDFFCACPQCNSELMEK